MTITPPGEHSEAPDGHRDLADAVGTASGENIDPVQFIWDFRDRIYHVDCEDSQSPAKGRPPGSARVPPPVGRSQAWAGTSVSTGRGDSTGNRLLPDAHHHQVVHFRMFTARAITSAAVTRDTAACSIIASFTHRDIGMVSVGLNAVAFVNDT